jgi:hypothetical protein
MQGSQAVATLSQTTRAAVSNGSRLHAKGVDLRTREARRFRDLTLSFAESFGGVERLTEAERSLIRSAASLTVQAERLHPQAAAGEAVDLEALTRLSNAQARVLMALKRKTPRPGTAPSPLHTYLDGRPEGR